ncbi:hypothetical protein LOTGIDRAFT_235171 [Lottia gigantea]|uniref:Ras-related protein Rab-36 n=1 Tax=Lottia gigantea TaxID=225164 RepID=V3ZWK8_LOTGI|nr:hypothetical protein LOTGIDRAFT_235171 [Lottia gigantea]ESO86990.1 hypothetical protein LOTGIDRAFT_235171 [Lottia gigantea]
MSSGRTVLSNNVAKDRIVSKFQQAYHADATPYQKMNFHPKVKAASSENRTGTVGLKISKAVIVGDVSVGKTCFVNRFCHDLFDRDYKATIGVDFEVEKFSILSTNFTLQIWDTAGQERFKCIAASYYRGANVVIVAFDLSDEESLNNVEKWMVDASENANDPVKFLVGNKRDLLSEAAYEDIESRAVEKANKLGAEFWAVSAKNGLNVREFFFRAVCLTYDSLLLNELESTKTVSSKQIGSNLISIQKENTDLYEAKNKQKSKCCS